MAKWKEVDIYTGLVVGEDAPTNATGTAVAGTGDDSSVVVVKKKKRPLIDGRTKEYRQHRERLEKLRQKRESARAKKVQEEGFVNKTVSRISQFSRESYLEEKNLQALKDIVKNKSAKSLKFKDGSMKVDMFTASAITQVYNKVNIDNKKKLEKMVNGTKGQFMALQSKVMKMVGKLPSTATPNNDFIKVMRTVGK